jgi:hypothetical protein
MLGEQLLVLVGLCRRLVSTTKAATRSTLGDTIISCYSSNGWCVPSLLISPELCAGLLYKCNVIQPDLLVRELESS